MSERIPTKKQNFDGIDPQESLIKSLESIKSLLKQGDSKINEARENIARADSSISSASIENRFNDNANNQSAKIPSSAFISSSSLQKTNLIESPIEQELNIIEDSIEEIVIDVVPAVPTNDLFNKTNKKIELDLDIKIKTESTGSKRDTTTPEINASTENSSLNDLYDHDLIVPMLDEIVMPEDQNSSFFNMDSSVEIKLDSQLKSSLLELNDTDEVNELDTAKKPEINVSNTTKDNKSSYSTIDKKENNANADIISFELSSSNIKKQNLKKVEKLVSHSDIPTLNNPKAAKAVSLVEDPQSNHVIIKETTHPVKKQDDSITDTLTDIKTDATSKLSKISEIDLSSAISSSTHTDNVLSTINNISNDKIKTDTARIKPKQITAEKTDFSTLDGLERIKFNAEKMSALQGRIEKRVHNRLIQLIVQLDDEIKTIFTDEIKNCIALEIENTESDND